MEDVSIIFFGKPDGFESYEFRLNGEKVKTDHLEPKLKLEAGHNDILHLYKHKDFSYIELYGFAKAFKSGRGGVVIGVALKSKKELDVSVENLHILQDLLGYFKKEALEGSMFKRSKISILIGSFRLNDAIFSDFNTTIEFRSEKRTIPLFLENYETSLGQILKFRKQYSDIYVSGDVSIYKTKLNAGFLYEINNNVYTIANNKLVEYTESTEKLHGQLNDTPESNEFERGVDKDLLRAKSKITDLETKLLAFRRSGSKKIKSLLVIICLSTFLSGYLFLKPDSDTSKNRPLESNVEDEKSKIDFIFTRQGARDTLRKIFRNIELFSSENDSVNYKAIIRDCNALNIDCTKLKDMPPAPINKISILIESGMTPTKLITKLNNKYTLDEIKECNPSAFKRDENGEYLIKGITIKMPCSDSNK